MGSLTISAIISLIEAAITELPALTTEIQSLFGGSTPPTAAQFAALRAKVAAENFGVSGATTTATTTTTTTGPA